jgi:hypothetical protein
VYNCSKVTGGKGNFQVKAVGYGSASKLPTTGVSQSGSGFSGISRNYGDGTYSLNVVTTCQWTVRVEVMT